MSDSGLIGIGKIRAAAIRGNITKGKRRRDKYKVNPKLCRNCNKELDYSKRRNSFCDHSCAASANNIGVMRHGKYVKKQCAMCSTITKNPKFCSTKCFQTHTGKRLEQSSLTDGCFLTAAAAKRYLLKIHGNICSVCKLSKWNNQQLSLCIDHINGNYEDHRFNNVRLICNNCDAQTDTYKGRNRGNGRHARRKRYQKGLSY